MLRLAPFNGTNGLAVALLRQVVPFQASQTTPILLIKLDLSSIVLAENSLHSANLCGPFHSIHTAPFGLLGDFSVDVAFDGGVDIVAGTGDVTGMDVVSIVGDERL